MIKELTKTSWQNAWNKKIIIIKEDIISKINLYLWVHALEDEIGEREEL